MGGGTEGSKTAKASVAIRGLNGGKTRDENTSRSGYSIRSITSRFFASFFLCFLVLSALFVEGKGRKVSGSVDLWIYVIVVCGGGKEDTVSISFLFLLASQIAIHHTVSSNHRIPHTPFQQTGGKTE